MLEAQKTQTGVIKTLAFAVAKMDGMDTCVSMVSSEIKLFVCKYLRSIIKKLNMTGSKMAGRQSSKCETNLRKTFILLHKSNGHKRFFPTLNFDNLSFLSQLTQV